MEYNVEKERMNKKGNKYSWIDQWTKLVIEQM